MPEPEDDDALWAGPTLSSNGRLEGQSSPVEPAPLPQAAEEQAPLELVEREPVPPRPSPVPFRPPLPNESRRWGVKLMAVALALGLGLLGAGLAVRGKRATHQAAPHPAPDTVSEPSLLRRLFEGTPSGAVVVTSIPPGATVRIDGQLIGTTPWAGDNRWEGQVPVVIELRGYRPWVGTLQGGEDVRLKAMLRN